MRRVLLVDDDDELREAMAELLEGEGYAVRQAADGERALEAITEERPDVIILDYVMPRMSGAEFRRAQRTKPGLDAIPVVLLTAALDSPDMDSIAPDVFVRKPFAVSALLDSVAEAAHHRAP